MRTNVYSALTVGDAVVTVPDVNEQSVGTIITDII